MREPLPGTAPEAQKQIIKAFDNTSQARRKPIPMLFTTPKQKLKTHFSRCPKQYRHYCIHGRCRFVVDEQTPSCMCEKGYFGARCERVDLFYLQQDRGQILVICLIAVMVVFIILVIGVCTCCQLQSYHKLSESSKTPSSFADGQDTSQENN
ncbi:hypothetical protein U0070_018449 [Myodes glareolus]|uniref:Probetacellulin n=1 Tax=Myodes glareolus TaxID=447135 RepID=A0AAW0JWW3_MYOGA